MISNKCKIFESEMSFLQAYQTANSGIEKKEALLINFNA